MKVHVFWNRLPFNWKTPVGYIVTVIWMSASYFLILSCLLSTIWFYAGCCWLIITFVEDITNDLELLSVGSRSDQRRLERFGKIIQLHIDVKQLSWLIILINYLIDIHTFSVRAFQVSMAFISLLGWLANSMPFTNSWLSATFYGLWVVCVAIHWHYYRK